jgi:GNAT superfamily N-acetyltransferase
MPPGAWRMPLGAQVLHGPSFLRVFGRRTPLALALITRLEGRHIREPHVYVAYVGVAPAGQGRGIGSALLRRVLDRCDADGLPAYLEASSPRNRALYERHGFVTLGELRLRDSPPLWPMRYAPPG